MRKTLPFIVAAGLCGGTIALQAAHNHQETTATAADETPAVTLPETVTVPLSDAKQTITATLVGTLFEEAGYSLNWSISDAAGNDDRSILSSISNGGAKNIGRLWFTGKTGTAYLRATARDWDEYNDYTSAPCAVTVTAPERPVTAMTFEQEGTVELTVASSTKNPLTLSPADATYTAVTYTSSDSTVAVPSSSGTVKTYKETGTAVITAHYAYQAGETPLTASFTVNVTNPSPVTAIEIADDPMTMEAGDSYSLTTTVVPADALIKDLTYTTADPTVATVGTNGIVSALKAGTTTLTVSATDGSGVTATTEIVVTEPDLTPYEGYENGTFILNEDWFGHNNSRLNFLTPEGNMMYDVYGRANTGEAFGATSCFATVYGGRLYAVSKQASDPGAATPGGGRLVVADAGTLKKVGALDELGGDGRTFVGVTPRKGYVGTSNGIVTLDLETLTLGKAITARDGNDLTDSQVGEMVRAGNYVFAIEQRRGTHVIDATADTLVTTLEASDIQAIAQGRDGAVWLATNDKFVRVDPATLTATDTLQLPDAARFSASWGAYQPASFMASHTGDVLYWVSGSNIYRYALGTDISTVEPLFSTAGLEGSAAGKQQVLYGAVRYDDRTDELVVLTTQSGWGTNYEYNWIHLVDGTDGTLKRTIALKRGYWFQELAVFPDKYAPEVTGLDAVTLALGAGDSIVDLTGKQTDRDNLACNIRATLADAGDNTIVEASLGGGRLTLSPKAEGTTELTLSVESNGVVARHTVRVTVAPSTGIASTTDAQTVGLDAGRLHLTGYEGWAFTLYGSDGQAVDRFRATGHDFLRTVRTGAGAYILHGTDGRRTVTRKLLF